LQLGHEAISKLQAGAPSIWKVGWATPGVRHQMYVEPQQTASARADLQDIFARVICHVLIDVLPVRALGEKILPNLLHLRNVYFPGTRFLLSPIDEGEAFVHASADNARRFFEQFSSVKRDRQREYLDTSSEE